MDAVSLHAVTRTHPGAHTAALHETTHAFPTGTFTAIMGPSGSGKSTLLHCAAGLDRPTSGSVRIGDTALDDLDETQRTMLRRERVGFVFQAYNLLPFLDVADNITLPLRLAGLPIDTRRLAEVAAHVGLTDLLDRRPTHLSGGQQQRVAVARALVTRPAVVFADEPTGALDRHSGRQVLELLRHTVDTTGQTVVMVTHDPFAAAYAHTVVLLADGRIQGTLTDPTVATITERIGHR
jgi:putative ABC transport system ATP-binding protein